MTHDELFENCCSNCKGWNRPCPVAFLLGFNDFFEHIKIPDNILTNLTDGENCKMFEMFKKELELTEDEKNQLEFIF